MVAREVPWVGRKGHMLTTVYSIYRVPLFNIIFTPMRYLF
jgi:hypothetical protein